MNDEQMHILTSEFGFVFPHDENLCTNGKTTISARGNRFFATRPGKLDRKLVSFDQVLRFIVQHG